MSLVRGSNSAFISSIFFFSSSSSMSRPSLVVDFSFLPSNSFNCWTPYSSIGSTMYNTSMPFFRRFSKKGDDDLSNALSCDVVNVILALLHAINILLEADGLVTRLGGLVSEELSNLHPVGGVLVDTELEALAKLLIELLVIVLLLSNLNEHFKTLLHQVLLDDSQDLVLLQGLTGDVQRKILRIDNTLDKIQPLRHQFIAIIHDEDTTHIELDVVTLLLGLEEIKWSTARDEQESTEFKLSFNAEMFDSQVVFPIVGQGLVE